MKIPFSYLLYSFIAFLGLTQHSAHAQSTSSSLPLVFPTPVSTELRGESHAIGKSVHLVVLPDVEAYTVTRVTQILNDQGVESIKKANKLPKVMDGTYVVLGLATSAAVNPILKQHDISVNEAKDGYTIASHAVDKGFLIALIGNNADGLFYATQTFRQLSLKSQFPSLVIHDYPAMPIRGTIEGFYGKPWTMEERKSHLNFLASIKANTYVYTPKDDPYARDKWREPYPKATLDELGDLAAVSNQNHINFVYAISPGPTVCFSCEDDLKALQDKFKALRSVGIHRFYVALDDIEYKQWNCEQDSITFGPSGAKAAGVAQSHLLNLLQAHIKEVDPTAPHLIMVPTEYYDAKETPYKEALRENLHADIVVQWTGTDVVPPSISINDAKAATKAFGKATLLWDNYPVNDFAETRGRLLLAPYDRREGGLAKELEGILSNPMNQEAASRPAVTGVVAFSWNDTNYHPKQTLLFAARELAGYDSEATAALLTFFDTQHLAPTFGTHPWQYQAPALKLFLDGVRDVLANGDAAARKSAIAKLSDYAKAFTNAADIIRAGKVDAAFVKESGPWLEAMALWGKALQATAAGLDAANGGNVNAGNHFAEAKKLTEQASVIPSTPGATRFEGPVKIADDVLDVFIEDAPKLIFIKK